jgi:hypothetical protein
MKQFLMMELHDAIRHAQDGGQSLHLHNITAGHPLFRRYSEIAHLFDMDANRIRQTATKLGVKVIKIERANTDRQHIDLCGKPLDRAKMLCEKQ